MKRLQRLLITALLSLWLTLGLHFAPAAQGQSNSLIQTGQAQYQAGQYADAAQSLDGAIATYRTTEQPLALARALGIQALALGKLGRWEAGNQAIAQSLSLIAELRKRYPSATALLNLTEAQVLSSQGQLQRSQGQAAEALSTWEAAEALYQQEDDTTGTIGSRINQIKALETLGFYRRADKQIDALASQLQPLSDSPLKAQGLLSLGTLLRLEGQLQDSQMILQQGLAITESADDRQLSNLQSQLLLSLANTERLMGNRAIAARKKAQAKEHTKAAIAHYTRAASLTRDPSEQVQIQLNHLSLLKEQDPATNPGAKQALAQQIRQNLDQLPVSRHSVYATVNFVQQLIDSAVAQSAASQSAVAQSSVALSDPGKSTPSKTQPKPQFALDEHLLEQLLQRAVAQAESLDDGRSQSYALGALGHWYELQSERGEPGQRDTAKDLTQSALEQAQRVNAPEIAYQWQWQLGRLNQADTSSSASTAAQRYYQAAYDTLNDLRSDLVALAPEIQFSFRERVEPVYREFVDLLLSDPQQSNLIKARTVIENLQLAELDNFFRDACAQAQPTTIDSIDPTAAIVYPILLDDRLEIIVKLPGDDTLRHFVQPNVSAKDVEQTVRRFRKLAVRRSVNFEKFSKTANQLYQWLIAPIETEIETALSHEESQIKTLSFVLDGSLRSLPMAALYDGEKFLVERYAIAVTPGLQLLDPQPIARQNLRVLLGGTEDAPSFEAEDLSKLPNVLFELQEIQTQVSDSGLLLKEQFQKDQISEKLNSQAYNVVHLATHGQFSSDPDQTFILDWDGRINVSEMDSLLRFSDPTQRNAIELLVLSACETARGDSRAALGLAGVAIRAGARSTLATLWQVDDFSTAEFMIKFYQQLNNSDKTKAEILREVQLSFIHNDSKEDLENPYHWAPFLLVGNWL